MPQNYKNNCCKSIPEEKKQECYRCDTKGCSDCVKECCCDCSVSLCKRCLDSRHVKCGCYGECVVCKKDVDRGSDGWPCHICEKWFCRGCRYKGENDCKECNPDECEKCGEESPQRVCEKCGLVGCQDCMCSYYHMKCGGYILCRGCYPKDNSYSCTDDKDCVKCCKK
jgi:hypothetical protein